MKTAGLIGYSMLHVKFVTSIVMHCCPIKLMFGTLLQLVLFLSFSISILLGMLERVFWGRGRDGYLFLSSEGYEGGL